MYTLHLVKTPKWKHHNPDLVYSFLSFLLQREVQARKIFIKHLSDSATEPVNIDSAARKAVQMNLQHASQDIFTSAQLQVNHHWVHHCLHDYIIMIFLMHGLHFMSMWLDRQMKLIYMHIYVRMSMRTSLDNSVHIGSFNNQE